MEDLKSKTVRQLQNYSRENKIRGYSKLKKSALIDLLQNNVYQFHNDLFNKPRKERELKVKCCDLYYKASYMKRHLQSKKHQTYEKANVFSFDASLFPKPKKARPTQIKCDECGKYYKPAYEGHHLRSIIHRRAVDKVPTHIEVPEVKDDEPKVTNWIFPKKQKPSEPTSEKPEQKKAEPQIIDETFHFGEVAEIVLVETAFLDRLETWVINNVNNIKNPIEFLEHCRTIVIAKLSQWAGIKTNLQLYCDFQREEEIQEFSFKTQNQIILESTDLNTFYVDAVNKLKREMEEFEARGSVWRLSYSSKRSRTEDQ
ncbi:hypothetical protein AVEN_108874-1 [Araneus ventricosus]|uniref:Rho termination factor-like N-terminal domain-containing protein n=1 Tax=Araneus ventricosus TaxID=182803 RepID=A0A4Y2TP75_ARAVE|nr:hypothetical protein AVEN_108874-1 [Araneus ventricosus]